MKRLFSGRFRMYLMVVGVLTMIGISGWRCRGEDICSVQEHQHTDICCEPEDNVLSCKKTEHVHGVTCVDGENPGESPAADLAGNSQQKCSGESVPQNIRIGVGQLLLGLLMLGFQKKWEQYGNCFWNTERV